MHLVSVPLLFVVINDDFEGYLSSIDTFVALQYLSTTSTKVLYDYILINYNSVI